MKTTRRTLPALILAVALAFVVSPIPAESLGSKKESDEVLAELKAIRQLLEKMTSQAALPAAAKPAAGDAKVVLADLSGEALGSPDAPLTIVEFSDLQCPYCRQFHSSTFEQLKRDYISTGKVRYVSRDFPLDSLHPFAKSASVATRCAGRQGKYWEMRHGILVAPGPLGEDTFASLATQLRLDEAAYRTCASAASGSEILSVELAKDAAAAATVGVSGTPTFIIGRTSSKGLEGVRLVGAQPYSVFDSKLKELLTNGAH